MRQLRTRDKAMREGCDIDECDDNEKCEIIGASFRGEAVEWRKLPGGGEVHCVCTGRRSDPAAAVLLHGRFV